MKNDSKTQAEQKLEAGRNTAHVVGKTAATKLGGRLGSAAYDKVAGTRLGQNLENRLGSKIAHTPVVGNLNKKLNDSGAVDAANNSLGSNQALQKNKANQKNILSSFLNKRKKKKEIKEENGDENNSSSDSDDNLNETEEETKEKVSIKKRAKQIKLAIMILGPAIFFLFIVLVSVAVVGYIGSLFGVISLGEGEITSMTDKENEEKYYKKLDEVIAKYQKKYNVTIDKNYIHTILIYPINNYFDYFEEDFSIENITEESIDYESLTGQIETVAKFFVSHCKSNKSCSIDYEIDGPSYNRIKESSFFKKHYKEMLKKADADTILEDVFNLAEVGALLGDSRWFINDNLKVTMGTCEQPYNNKLLNEGTNYSSSVGFSEYIMGVIYGEVGDHNITNETKEFLKAFTLVTSSYVLNRAGYQPGDTEIFVHNGNCWQLSCDIKNGCTYAYDPGKYGTTYTGDVEKNDIAFVKPPLPQDKIRILNEVFDEVFGMLLLDGSGNIKWADHYNSTSNSGCKAGRCMGQQEAIIDSKNGMSYKEILDKYYDNYTITNAKEDLYADNVSYSDGGYNAEVIYYNQNDYGNVTFCGRTSNTSRPGTIKTSGCGTTAMSIVLSTLVDEKLDPVAVMKEAYGLGSCGVSISGTSTTFFKKSAKLHDLDYKKVGKRGDLQAVLDSLESGNSLVIAHMGPSTFTKSGHYIVLARVNENGKVYVYDSNKPSRNGWYDFNSVIVKELRGSFHIITKG